MGLFRSVERFGVIRFQDQQWTNGERGIRTLGTDDPYYGLAIRRFGPLSHLSKMEKFLFNKMNGGVKVYTIACTDCIDNITNIAIIQLEKNESGELYFSFRFKRFCLFSDLPGQWPGRSEKRKNQSYNALPNLIAKLIVAKARTKAIKN